MPDRPSTLRLFWWGVVAIWLVGAIMTAGTINRLRAARPRLLGKLRDWQELKLLEKEVANYAAARRFFESLPVKHPAPLDPFLKKSGMDARVKDIANPPACVPGWGIRQKDVDFGETEAPLATIMQWIRETEWADPARPPWRVARMSIRASSRHPGAGHVVLLLEALEQVEASRGRHFPR